MKELEKKKVRILEWKIVSSMYHERHFYTIK